MVQHAVEDYGVVAIDRRVGKQPEIQLAGTAGGAPIVGLRLEPGPHGELERLPPVEAGSTSADAALHRDRAVDLKALGAVGVDELHGRDAFGAVLRLIDVDSFAAEPVVLVHDQRDGRDRLEVVPDGIGVEAAEDVLAALAHHVRVHLVVARHGAPRGGVSFRRHLSPCGRIRRLLYDAFQEDVGVSLNVCSLPAGPKCHGSQTGCGLNQDWPVVDAPIARRGRAPIERETNRSLWRGRRDYDLDRMIVQTAIVVEHQILNHGQALSVVRRAGRGRQSNPVVRAIGVAAERDIGPLGTEADAVKQGQSVAAIQGNPVPACVERQAGVQTCIAGVAIRPDHQIPFCRQDGAGRNLPLRGVVQVVRQVEASETDRCPAKVEQLDPVVIVALRVFDRQIVGGHDLVDAHIGLGPDTDRHQECREEYKTHRSYAQAHDSSILY